MTYEDVAEVRRTSVGTKVLIFGFAILAILGSFWAVVWFIRAYVEPPRVMLPAPMALAARDSTPVVPPTATVAPPTLTAAEQKSADTAPAATALLAPPPSVMASAAEKPADQPAGSPISDRWFPANQAPEPVPPPAASVDTAPAPTTTAPAGLATASDKDLIEEVAEGSVPAISGPAPLPRRKPQIASAAKRTDPPLPRPRPDGPAPQSVWTASPVSDDRFPQ